MARIVNRKEFLQYPAGTLFRKYNPCVMDDLAVKVSDPDTYGNDFVVQCLDEVEGNENTEFFYEEDYSKPFKFTYDFAGRDGFFDEDQLFVVYDKMDLRDLIDYLSKFL